MKRIITISILAFFSLNALAQNDLTFYHLGNATPQGNHVNPAFFPESKVYVSIPVLSGIRVGVNNNFTYNDIFIDVPGEDSVRLDVDQLLEKLDNGSSLNFNTNISWMQVGFRLKDYGAVTIFANERVNAGLIYPKKLLEYLWRGNGDFIGETFTESSAKIDAIHYREFGVGYTHNFTVLGNKTLKAGARIKYLQGFLNVKSADNLSVDLTTEPDQFNLNIAINDPAIFTAGIDILDDDDSSDSYFVSNQNTGIGFDLGAELEYDDKWKFSLAINDMGSITWKEAVTNYTVNNQVIDFTGLDLKDLDDVSQAIEDTLSSKFDDQENEISYSTGIGTKTFIGASYKVSPKGRAMATISNSFIVGKSNTSFGVGYTHQFGKIFTLSGTISKKPQQAPNIGGGFATRFGFFQMYGVIDDILGFADARNIQTVDFRFGINFLFGRPGVGKEKKNKKELNAIPEEYQDNSDSQVEGDR